MEIILAFLYFSFLALLAWRNFKLALVFFVVLLPAYLIRLQIGPLPSTVLELSFGAIFLVWLIKYSRKDLKEIWQISKRHKVFFVCFDLFFLASVISIFVSDMWWFSLGEWRAYFLEPMILFLILLGSKERVKAADLVWGLAFSTLSISIYAIWQKLALGMDRTTSFFTSPNSVGLYLGPIVLLILVEFKNKWARYFLMFLSLVVIFFTKSQGAWVALVVSGVLVAFIVGYRKVAVTLAIGGLVFSLLVPSLRQALLFQDQAGQNRSRLWGYTQTFLTKSPKNFVFGTGVRQFFRKVQKQYYDKKVMERLIYPHNFFLNFWTETGLMGMIAMTAMVGWLFYLAGKVKKINKWWGAGLAGGLTVLVVHGLVDVPYFKNDLAFLFWIIAALFFVSYAHFYQSQTERL